MKAVNRRDSLFNVCTARVLTARPSQYFDCSATILKLQTHQDGFYIQFDKLLLEDDGGYVDVGRGSRQVRYLDLT